jgi:hypothetical protein
LERLEDEKHIEDDEDDAIELKIQATKEVQEVQEEEILDEQKRAKDYRNLRQLESSFNPEASRIVERIEQGREILLDHANFALFCIGPVDKVEPATFEEAWNQL